MRRTSHLRSFAFFRQKLLRPRVMFLGYDVGGGGVSPPYYFAGFLCPFPPLAPPHRTQRTNECGRGASPQMDYFFGLFLIHPSAWKGEFSEVKDVLEGTERRPTSRFPLRIHRGFIGA